MKVIKQNTVKRICFLVILICSLTLAVNAQEASGIKPLKVGDSVPEIIFNKMINYETETAKLSDFRGKAIILDFWAIWCVPCITSFPKLQKFQEKYNRELRILLLSRHDEKGTIDFYQNRRLTLPTAFYDRQKDTVIEQLFPHYEIPHYIWINKANKIYAITDGSELTESNVTRFLTDQSSTLTLKNDSVKYADYTGAPLDSIVRDKYGINKISINKGIIFQSMILKYDKRLSFVELNGSGEDEHKYLSLQNLPPSIMMQYALGYRGSKQNWRFYLDFKDTSLYIPQNNISSREREKWNEEHCFTYRIITNKRDSSSIRNIMRRDLEYTFGLHTYKKKIKVPYLVLQTVGDTARLSPRSSDSSSYIYTIYNITLKNRPIEDLITGVRRYHVGDEFKLRQQRTLLIKNRTNIKGNIDLDIGNINITDFEKLNQELRKNGLELKKKVGKVSMIVITDK
ncbi:TlpA family protein disulfide reductase [Olivibacter jilunii]|uniref:TlpA family protein disulfide reductase n=1 Tax=Olivibacter jilunii TaxID=985016 RepID=UPI00102FC723|nr:TlpA disulfide reductase family protein [Olivibacter jilunii]